MAERKICELTSVRGYPDAGDTPQIWLNPNDGRYTLMVHDGLMALQVDLFDLVDWLDGPGRPVIEDLRRSASLSTPPSSLVPTE